MNHKTDGAVRAFSMQLLLLCAGALQRGSESSAFPSSDHINDGPFILSFSPRGLPWTSYLPLSLFWPPPTNYPRITSQSRCAWKLPLLIYCYPTASRVLSSPIHPPYLLLETCPSTDHRCCLELTSVLLSCSFSVPSPANFFSRATDVQRNRK